MLGISPHARHPSFQIAPYELSHCYHLALSQKNHQQLTKTMNAKDHTAPVLYQPSGGYDLFSFGHETIQEWMIPIKEK